MGNGLWLMGLGIRYSGKGLGVGGSRVKAGS